MPILLNTKEESSCIQYYWVVYIVEEYSFNIYIYHEYKSVVFDFHKRYMSQGIF